MSGNPDQFKDWQRALDRDPIFQRLQDALDSTWWKQQDDEQQLSRQRDNQEKTK